MPSSMLLRWAGSALIAGATLLAIGELIHPANVVGNVTTFAWATTHYLLLLALLLGIPGLFGLYARQANETKGLGFLGFILIFVAMTLLVGIVYFEVFIAPALATVAPAFVDSVISGQADGPLVTVPRLTGWAFSLGWLLFGWATVKARVLPRTAAWLGLAGGVVLGLGPLRDALPFVDKLAAVAFGVGVAWLGNALRTEKRAMMG